MKRLTKATWAEVALGLGISVMVGGGIYWLHGSLEIAIVVAVIPLHYFLRDALGQYYALRRDAEPAEKTDPKKGARRTQAADADEAGQ